MIPVLDFNLDCQNSSVPFFLFFYLHKPQVGWFPADPGPFLCVRAGFDFVKDTYDIYRGITMGSRYG